MAIYSTFFLCEQDALAPAFPEWKLPLPEPVERTAVDPFTGDEMTITTRAPEWEDFDPENFDPEDMELPEPEVVAIDGDYATYLEGRIPEFVRAQPHQCGKNLTSMELEPLIALALGVDEVRLESALYAHPLSASGLEQIPGDFVNAMKNADDAALQTLAEKWAAHMSTPDYTHSLDGEQLSEGWTTEDALSQLMPIAELARQQTGNQSMYLLIEG